jgi:pimeloyl-ACP methyl ester carboxylesterase
MRRDFSVIEFLAEIDGPGDHLIVAFTGINQRMGGVPFEFHKALGAVGVKVLFVRDPGQRWYQYDAEIISDAARRITDTAVATGVNHLSCIGNSMGGFGALLFGQLCAADAILAFAPQTTILPSQTSEMGDQRWLRFQRNIAVYPLPDLNALSSATGRVTVVHGSDDVLDAAHAERLIWTKERIVQPGCGHNVARVLKEQGELPSFIQKVLFH